MKLFEKVGNGGVYFIAEMSGNHGGDLEYALEIVRAAHRAGADCLKTQTYTPDSITLQCDSEPFQIKKGLWAGRTLYDLYSEAQTPFEWQDPIKAECDKLGMDFLSSVFDFTSVDYLEGIGVEAYKIASPELVDIPLIKRAAATGKPILISTGMGTLEEIEDAVAACASVGNQSVVLLKCTSEYPAPFDDLNLTMIPDLARRFGKVVGFSDHTLGSTADVAAVALGARVIEKHFCITREHESVDSVFSMDELEFANMVRAVSDAAKAVGDVRYKRTAEEEASTKKRRSIFACADIRAGERFSEKNCRSVRPGIGLAPKYYEKLIGRKSVRNIAFGEPILPSDLSGHDD